MTAVTATDSALINSYLASQKANAAAAATTTATEDSTTALNADFNTFLKILTAQLKNQDPTEPVDAAQFTQQLVQYSQVEQQMATNSKLDDLLTSINSNGITPLLSYVGQYVETPTTDELVVQNGQALMAYTLPTEAQSAVISVQDDKGNVIATIDGATEQGLNRVAWDGVLASGAAASDGVYKFVLTAKNSSGDLIAVSDVRAIGQVTGIETGADDAVKLMVGDMEVEDKNVLSVFGLVAGTDQTETAAS